MEKRLLEEKEESPAKKLKMETKATEDEVDNRRKATNLEEKVKKAQNVREKLAEMKNVYVEDMEDDDAEDDEDKKDFDDEDDDVLIEKATLSEDAKEGIVEEQTPTETNCQVSYLYDYFVYLLNWLSLFCSFVCLLISLPFVEQICKLSLRPGSLPMHMQMCHSQKKQVKSKVHTIFFIANHAG